MKTSDLSFELPPELIAQHPPKVRGESRLMVTNRSDGSWRDMMMRDIATCLEPGTVMVFNDSRVRRGRIYGVPVDSPDKTQEFLLLQPTEASAWLCLGPNSRRLKEGRAFVFARDTDGECRGEITAREGAYRVLTFDQTIDDTWLEQYGHMPLPPYIRRQDTKDDADRYQTVYSQVIGSVAAPTAGLHFTEPLLEELRNHGVITAFVTLHVGIGTFLPVRTEELEEHQMHSEDYVLPRETAEAIVHARSTGKPVLAVGTTAVRTLESMAQEGRTVRSGSGSTAIFITPGYQFAVVDQLFTNFHTPESTLIALVSAFSGREHILSWYTEAVKKRYRFFSYGDAMLLQ
jgi:S-adenosylmethionine:tRNA ribosyltransferase-isomerase